MSENRVDHVCDFKLEQTPTGYFTGRFACTFCGRKLSQTQWLDTMKKPDSDQPDSLPEAA
jgi:hypothetical protein